MTNKEYISEATRTNTGLKIPISENNEDLLHAILGLASESGEIAGQLKAHLYYGKPLDIANLKEEMGDLSWFLALLCSWLEIPLDEIHEANIEKLKVRYPDLQWNKKHALKRNTNKEMEVFKK